ncbi:DUF5117 domain-containing protein, partial [Piscinibacter sp.]|uniref:DUF5117 and DUF5118 domain-containing protein n=1 Tax=Piscinibacter sp. TaxID=1903157 RepID=UPI002C39B167
MKYTVAPRAGLTLLAAPWLVAVLGGCATASAGPSSDAAMVRAPAAPASSVARAEEATPADAVGPVPKSGAAPSKASPSGSGLRPFADVVKGARQIDGLFTVWQKDDKVWLELKPSDLDQPFFMSPKSMTGIGEGKFFGGLMADEVVIEFRRVHNQLQMVARNTEFVAQAGTPTGRAVEAAFSPSLLASTSVLSQPHPERQSVLVEANALFINDMLGTGMRLQRTYRQGYSLDTRNSAITDVRATPDLLVLEVMNHYATGSIATPSSGGSGSSPSVPRSLADPRSLFMNFHYSLAKLPEQPMAPRRADARVGYFTSSVTDFSDDLARTPRQRYVNRWRLEKKDPAAELSEPVKPIVFWLDRTVPEKYRASITAGVLEWNKAFEKIGFKNALRVQLQPADAEWDTLDFGRASIRWMTNASPSFGAIGPSHVDPRSGEILDADIGIESLSSRNLRSLRAQVLASTTASGSNEHDGHGGEAAFGLRGKAHAFCDHADHAAEQLSYAMDVL